MPWAVYQRDDGAICAEKVETIHVGEEGFSDELPAVEYAVDCALDRRDALNRCLASLRQRRRGLKRKVPR